MVFILYVFYHVEFYVVCYVFPLSLACLYDRDVVMLVQTFSLCWKSLLHTYPYLIQI